MALPPEPLAELLKDSSVVVVAEVSQVVETGPAPEQPKAKPGATSVGYKAPSQVLVLKVGKALKGKAAGSITVAKPVAGYALKAGDKGAFFLQDGQEGLGVVVARLLGAEEERHRALFPQGLKPRQGGVSLELFPVAADELRLLSGVVGEPAL